MLYLSSDENQKRSQLLHTYFEKSVRIHGADAGMHIVAEFDKVVFSKEIIKSLLTSDVYTVPVEEHSFTKGTHKNQIILGYAGLGKDEMETGIKTLKQVIETSIITPELFTE